MISIIQATTFEKMIHVVTHELPELLDVDFITLAIEATQDPGFVPRLIPLLVSRPLGEIVDEFDPELDRRMAEAQKRLPHGQSLRRDTRKGDSKCSPQSVIARPRLELPLPTDWATWFHRPALSEQPKPPVWQPLTFSGVAAFARARWTRLLLRRRRDGCTLPRRRRRL